MATPTPTVTIPSATRYLARVRRFVDKQATAAGLSERAADEVRLAVDEACANAIEHAYGGRETGVPFTNTAGRRLQRVLHAVGLLDDPAADAPATEDVFFSYLHTCVADGEPTPASYADCEQFFDAELRAFGPQPL